MILLSEVSKRFGSRGVQALHGLSLSIDAGETVAITGPNGAGKTTLLALVLGFLRPTGGALTIDDLSPRAFVRRNGAGWVPERFELPRAWRTRRTIEYFARLDGLRSDTAPMAAAALEHFGLKEYSGRPTGDLSHGLHRRLALAIATITPRRLVVLDEPTEGLDDEGRDRLHERCAWLQSRGSTVLLATQDARAVDRLADRIIRLNAGRLEDAPATRPDTGAGVWQIELDPVFERFEEAFPDAVVVAPGRVFRVSVRDPAELSSRLRSLLDAGAILRSVRPAKPVANGAPTEPFLPPVTDME